MKAIYALCSSPVSALRARDAVREAGVAQGEITILSSEPLEVFDPAGGQSDSVPWSTVLGGLTGCVAGVALTSLSQLSWPLNTGGMPIVSIVPNLIIIFEMTMLFAILATVITLCVTSRLPRRLPGFYDPEVSSGKILVGVENPRPDQVAEVEQALEAHGEMRRME